MTTSELEEMLPEGDDSGYVVVSEDVVTVIGGSDESVGVEVPEEGGDAVTVCSVGV